MYQKQTSERLGSIRLHDQRGSITVARTAALGSKLLSGKPAHTCRQIAAIGKLGQLPMLDTFDLLPIEGLLVQ